MTELERELLEALKNMMLANNCTCAEEGYLILSVDDPARLWCDWHKARAVIAKATVIANAADALAEDEAAEDTELQIWADQQDPSSDPSYNNHPASWR